MASPEEDETRTVGAIATGVVALIAIVLSAGALIIASNAGDGASATGGSGEDDAGGSDAPSTVEVDLAEFSIVPTDLEVAAGGTIEVTNAGSIEHDLEVVDGDVGTQMLAAGQSESLALGDLAPGTYEVRCTVPGHDSAGMVTSLTIAGEGGSEDGADPAAGGDHARGDRADGAGLVFLGAGHGVLRCGRRRRQRTDSGALKVEARRG